MPTHSKEQHLPFKQMDTTTIFFICIQSCVWPHSDQVFWQNPCSGWNSRIDLVVALEYNLFQLCSNTEKISVRLIRFRRSYIKWTAARSNQPHKLHSIFTWCVLRCSKWPRSFFCSCFFPMIVYLLNLFCWTHFLLACC